MDFSVFFAQLDKWQVLQFDKALLRHLKIHVLQSLDPQHPRIVVSYT